MKLAIVTYSLNIGGAEKSVLYMTKLFKKNGYNVEVIETERKGPWHNYFINEGISVKTYNFHLLSIPYLHSLKISRKLKQYDVVFIIDSPFAQASLGKIKQETICFPQLRANIQSMYFNAASNDSQWNYVTAVSPLLKEEFIKLYPHLSDRILVIPNGIKVSNFRNINIAEFERIRVVFIGRLDNDFKGVLVIPEILAKLTVRGYDITLTIVGDGPLRDELLQELHNNVLGSQVNFLGFIDHQEVHKVLQSHNFLLMPSINEGFPNVMLEAMANQVIPIVSCLKGVTDQIIQDSYNGFFGLPGNADSFVSAFERALEMKHKLKEVAENAYETVKEKYSMELVEKNYLELIKKAATNSIKRSGSIDIRLLKHYYRNAYLPVAFSNLQSWISTMFMKNSI